jgi:hemerythrin-like domain-containing protein
VGTVTNTIVVEHRVISTVFDQIESRLPALETLAEAKFLADLITSLLDAHGKREESLAYAALDHMLAERGQINSLYQDHEEIDGRLAQIKATPDLKEACRLLTATIKATRNHFQREERIIFPLIERTLQEQTLKELNNAWIHPIPTKMSPARAD